MKAVVGERYRLTQHVGYQPDIDPNDPTPIPDLGLTKGEIESAVKNRHWPVFAGQVGVVDEIVPAEVEGAGSKDEDHAVLVFEMRELTNHVAGRPADQVTHQHHAPAMHGVRRVSFTQEQLDNWFEPAAEGAEAEHVSTFLAHAAPHAVSAPDSAPVADDASRTAAVVVGQLPAAGA